MLRGYFQLKVNKSHEPVNHKIKNEYRDEPVRVHTFLNSVHIPVVCWKIRHVKQICKKIGSLANIGGLGVHTNVCGTRRNGKWCRVQL